MSFLTIGIVLYFTRFLSYYPNRIAQSRSVFFANIDIYIFIAVEIVILMSAIFNVVYNNLKKYINILSSAIIVVLCLYISGLYADNIYKANHIVRIAFGTGFWVSMFFVYIITIDAIKEFRMLYKIATVFLFLYLFVFFAVNGHLDKIDIMREFYIRKTRFDSEILTHLYLVFSSVLTASCISFPLGIMAYKSQKNTQMIFTVLNILQTIPSIAMFGALILPLAYLSKHSQFLSNLGISGIGYAPAFIALVVYAMLPLVRNIYSGLKNVPQDVKQASMGMGMNKIQILFKVELPLSIVEILTGLKISLVQTVGNTALAALIGAGGLGVFIFQGLGEASNSLIMLGVLPLVFIAVSLEYIMNIFILLISKKIYRYD